MKLVKKGVILILNEKIKKLAQERGVSNSELARAAGTSSQFICNVLKGYKMPSVPVLKRMSMPK